LKKLTSIIFCALASFNLSAHGEGIVGLHIHGESTLVLGLILAMLIVMPMYFSKKLLLIKKEK